MRDLPSAAGSAEIDLSDAERVARLRARGEAHADLGGPSATLPKNKVKLLLNLVALGVVALPRGGAVGVEIKGEAPAVSLVSAQGEPARLSEHVTSLLAGANGLTLDAHSIQPYYANRMRRGRHDRERRDPRQGSRAAGRLSAAFQYERQKRNGPGTCPASFASPDFGRLRLGRL